MPSYGEDDSERGNTVDTLNSTSTTQRKEHSTLGTTLLFGVPIGLVAAALLGLTAYYRIPTDDPGGTVVFALLAVVLFLVLGYLVAQRTLNAFAGIQAGLLAGVIGATGAAIIDQLVAQANLTLWYQRIAQQCTQAPTPEVCIDQPTLLAHETSVVVALVIGTILGAVALSAIGAFVGASNGSRSAATDAADDNRIIINQPLVPAHRTIRGQGMDYPQSNKPSI